MRKNLILCLLLVTGCSKAQWKDYSYADAGFAVSSPTPPRIKKPNSIMTEYLMELPHGAIFSVMYVDLEEPPINDASAKANMDKLASFISKGTPALDGVRTLLSVGFENVRAPFEGQPAVARYRPVFQFFSRFLEMSASPCRRRAAT